MHPSSENKADLSLSFRSHNTCEKSLAWFQKWGDCLYAEIFPATPLSQKCLVLLPGSAMPDFGILIDADFVSALPLQLLLFLASQPLLFLVEPPAPTACIDCPCCHVLWEEPLIGNWQEDLRAIGTHVRKINGGEIPPGCADITVAFPKGLPTCLFVVLSTGGQFAAFACDT